MRGMQLVLAAALALSTAAVAQTSGADIYKGRVKPGLYDLKTETTMKNVPGVPPGKSEVETKKHCVTAEEVAKGLEIRKECKVKTNNATATAVQMVYECDGLPQEFHLKPTAGGHETRVVMNDKGPDGKPFSMTMTSQWKYLGACKG